MTKLQSAHDLTLKIWITYRDHEYVGSVMNLYTRFTWPTELNVTVALRYEATTK